MPATLGRACSWSDLLESRETASGQTEQLRGAREVPVGGAWLTVTQVSRQRRQARLDVLTVAVPIDQGVNGEGVAQIVNVGIDRRLSSDAGGVDELPKRDQDVGVEEAGADDRDEEAGWMGRRLQLVPPSGVGGQGPNCAGLQRNFARLGELG